MFFKPSKKDTDITALLICYQVPKSNLASVTPLILEVQVLVKTFSLTLS